MRVGVSVYVRCVSVYLSPGCVCMCVSEREKESACVRACVRAWACVYVYVCE